MTHSHDRRDRTLGMDRPITRRDFLNGVAVGIAAAVTAPAFGADPSSAAPESPAAAVQDAPGYYPPLLDGLRGSHPGSFEDAHALRDGRTFPPPIDTGEEYDLIVVGAGISGLAAAHFYRDAAGPDRRILLLDNHDDFGGHAKRNEFDLDGSLALMNGGTLDIDSPRPYSAVSQQLMKRLGLDIPALIKTTQDLKFYRRLGLNDAIFFDRETFGRDKLLVGLGEDGAEEDLARRLADAPLSEPARRDIVLIETGQRDFMPGLSSDAKKRRLSRMSYQAFLSEVVGAGPEVIKFYQARTHGEWGVGIDAVSALDCWALELPGFKGMNLKPGAIDHMGYTPAGYAATGGSYKLHFPDGNATIARLLVRNLIPAAVPGEKAADILTARVNYAALDGNAPVRLRLNSIVTAVRHRGAPDSAASVEATYLRGGRPHLVRGRGVVLAGYNMMIPYLCPELPAAQREALHQLVKTPLVYTSVALRNWQAFARLKIEHVHAPGSYHTSLRLNRHVDWGGYRSPGSPDRPILVHMVRTPCKPRLSEHEQNKAGRAELLSTPFSTFERNIREQLQRTLEPGGFDAARDISAITVNRWPHGYAPEYNPLFDPDVPESQRPHVIGRARFGRIVIANSDSGGAAYTDSAIDQANRAVSELLAVAHA